MAKKDGTEGKSGEADENVEGLIKVKKQGETLYVHPTCVNDHVALGWKVVGE